MKGMLSSTPKGLFSRERVYTLGCAEYGVKMVKQVLGKWLNDVLKHWRELPPHHGGMYDIGIVISNQCNDILSNVHE